MENTDTRLRQGKIGRFLISLPIGFCLFGALLWSVIWTAEHTPVPPLLIPLALAALLFVKTKWRIPPLTHVGTKVVLGVVVFPISLAAIAFTLGDQTKIASAIHAKPRTEQDYKNDLLSGKYNKNQHEFMRLLSDMERQLSDTNWAAITGKGKDGNLAPENIDEQLQALRSQVDFILGAGSPAAKLWKASVNGVTRDGPYVVLHVHYGSHQYALYIFDSVSKEQVQQLKEDDEILFSGNLGPERSMMRWAALAVPSYRLYPTYVTNGSLEIKQRADQVAQLEQREAAARLGEALAPEIIQSCKQHVLATLKYPASGSFSWFKSDLRKVGENEWLYTDVVKAMNDFGGKLPVRIVCEAKLEGSKVRTSVRRLDGE